ncbi:hypothetical protein [Mycolicibacterium sp.]|uniref:GAP1-N2 domain-containing protein n=1 Tax=Mycolicibacterium sp. TaxID=2320850 RepID=UPI0037CAFF34
MTTGYPPAAGASAPISVGTSRAHYGQLLYTSFDDPSGVGGGWQVKDENGELTAEERELLTARVVTTFDVDPVLPQFPTADQIAGRPARLAYAPTGSGAAAYWHTVDAGNDATGRPGNVMAHILLDREINAASAHRPVQLWNSPHWRRPYGPAEVLATELDVDVPHPNPDITAATAIHFLTGTAVDRQGTFRVLLDAVYAAMTGGPKVVLLTGDNTTGPLWIAAVSFFMSPGTSRRFSWSTHDKPPLAVTDLRRGMHLVVMPRGSAPELPDGDWIVLDELDEPAVRELGSTHSTGTAQVTVTPWSTLAEGVLADETMALQLLNDQDAVAEEVGDHDLSPIWPLAVAVSRRSDLAEFHRDAQHALAEDAPPHITAVGWLDHLVAEATAATAPATLDEARERLAFATERGTGIRHAAMHYLSAALTEPSVSDHHLFDIPTAQVLTPPDWQPALERLWSRIGAHDGDASRDTRVLLIAAELLQRLAEPSLAVDTAMAAVATKLTAERLDVLYGPAADTVTGLHGISAPVRETVLRPALAATAIQRDLKSLPLSVWQWAFSDEDVPTAQRAEPPANPGAADRALYPSYVRALLSSGVSNRLPTAWCREIAGHAIFMALDSETLSNESCRDIVTTLVPHAGLDGAEMTDVFTRWPQRVSPAAAATAVLYQDCPQELLSMVAAHPINLEGADDIGDQLAVVAARLRRLATASTGTHQSYTEAVTADAPALLTHLPPDYIGRIVQDIADVLIAACIAGKATEQGWVLSVGTVTDALQHRIDHSGGSTASRVSAFIEAGVIDAGWVAGEAFLNRFGDTFGAQALLGRPANRQRDNAFGDEIVALLVKRRTYSGPRDTAALRDNVWWHVRQLTAAHAEEFFGRYPKLAREWLHDHGL